MLFIISMSWASTTCFLGLCSSTEEPQVSKGTSILEADLQSCSKDPLTGFYRDSYCRTDSKDKGIHVVCAEMTDAFLQYTKSQGNDLQTPAPQYNFPGLKAGDRWCLCAARWYEAHTQGVAPIVIPEATDKKASTIVPLSVLLENSSPANLHP